MESRRGPTIEGVGANAPGTALVRSIAMRGLTRSERQALFGPTPCPVRLQNEAWHRMGERCIGAGDQQWGGAPPSLSLNGPLAGSAAGGEGSQVAASPS